MTTTRQRMSTVFDGGTPDITPFYAYNWFANDMLRNGGEPLFKQGLGIKEHAYTIDYVEHGVETSTEERKVGADTYETTIKQTPVGRISQTRKNGWHHEDWIKEPEDYLTLKWIVDHCELIPRNELFEECEERIGDRGLTVVLGTHIHSSRSPLMSINIDWAGTEQFCMDMGEALEELLALHESKMHRFEEEMHLIAKGPGKYVKLFENLSIDMLGPARYRSYLVDAYKRAVEILEPAGKRLMVHYDGHLAAIRDDITAAPIHMVESLSEAPEGDLTYEQCRAAWPDKALLCHINLDLYKKTPEAMREAVLDKLARLGKRGVAFSISEATPENWQTMVPVILDALEEAN